MSSSVGGQAVPGGVALRSGDRLAVAVRTLDGNVASTAWQVRAPQGMARMWGARGLFALATAMTSGVRAMRWARSQRRPDPLDRDPWLRRALDVTPVVSLMVLIIAAPALVARLLPSLPVLLSAMINSWTQVLIFLVTLLLLAQVGAVRALLANHGAEHKVVATHEAGLPPSIAAAQGAARFHPRCGTSFAALLVIASSVVYPLGAIVPGNRLLVDGLITLLLIAGTYEVQRAAARNLERSRTARALLAPGLWLQHVTTVEPSEPQLEVALAALTLALAPAASATAPALTR